jgi:hypothetical protein
VFLLISASWVARITSMSQKHRADQVFKKKIHLQL